jgi:hypothetical protein
MSNRQIKQATTLFLLRTRVASKSASLTPGHDSVLDGAGTSAGEEGTPRVPLARVDST